MKNFLIMILGIGFVILAVAKFSFSLSPSSPMIVSAWTGVLLFIVCRKKFREEGHFKAWLLLEMKQKNEKCQKTE